MPTKVPKHHLRVCQPTKKPLSRYLAGLESRKPRKKPVMNSKCPFDPNSCRLYFRTIFVLNGEIVRSVLVSFVTIKLGKG